MNDLVKKLKLKPGVRAAVVHAPDGYLSGLDPLPEGVRLDEAIDGHYDWVQVFARSQAELSALAPSAVAALKPGSLLWVCFPKGSSNLQTDLTRDQGWDPLRAFELKWINLVSIDQTWSAFSMRLFKPGEAKTSFR